MVYFVFNKEFVVVIIGVVFGIGFVVVFCFV